MSSKNRNKSRRRETNKPSLRIIAGSHRGSKLHFADDVEGLRPTTDRVRETVFNWLAPYLPAAKVLDAFAGSGAMAVEAVSRGASAVAVEKNTRASEVLNQEVSRLKISQISVVKSDVITYLQSCDRVFDVVFIDPPFSKLSLVEGLVDVLIGRQLLRDNALAYLESPKSDGLVLDERYFELIKEKSAGQVRMQLYRLKNRRLA